MSTSSRRPFVAGNWKLNGDRDSARRLALDIAAGAIETCDTAVCPVTLHLPLVAEALKGSPVALGAQNCAFENDGAFTGEVAAPMIAEFGCRYVIVGHSERRQLFGEDDDTVAAKSRRVLDAGMVPIVCVGETLDEREADRVDEVIGRQVDAVVDALGERTDDIVIAYEPVWAIGTGKTASPEQAQEAHHFIRGRLPGAASETVRLLYGGSVKPDNAASLFEQADIDGGLIGGASLQAADFLAICRAAG